VQRPRPGTVTVASLLLFGLAVLQLISVVIQLTAVGTTTQAIRDYGVQVGETATSTTAATVAQVTTYFVVGLGLLYAAAFAVLGMLVGKGRNAARITTWVLAGLSLCCGVGGLAGNAASGLMQGGNTGAFDSAAMTRLVESRLPGWYTPVVTTISVLTIVLALAVIILLALPAANDFFRKPAAPAWEPPPPGVDYPPPPGGGPSDPGYPPPR
jgi:hypothetical protein